MESEVGKVDLTMALSIDEVVFMWGYSRKTVEAWILKDRIVSRPFGKRGYVIDYTSVVKFKGFPLLTLEDYYAERN